MCDFQNQETRFSKEVDERVLFQIGEIMFSSNLAPALIFSVVEVIKQYVHHQACESYRVSSFATSNLLREMKLSSVDSL